jgi:hypothetical protein
VKVSGGSRFPVVPVAIVGGIVLGVLLIVYLVYQSTSGGSSLESFDQAAADKNPDLPGTWVENQGRVHYPGNLAGHVMTPFCDGVPSSDSAKKPATPYGAGPNSTITSPTSTTTPTQTPTPNASGTQTTPDATPTVRTDCYLSNPPSSGTHLNVENKADLGNGTFVRIPPDPGVYPIDVEIPRDAIPHILEHAGIFVGYNCKAGDSACDDVTTKLTTLVNDRIDNNDNRVVLAHDNDLPEGTIGLSAWSRVMDIPYTDWEAQKGEVERFIARHSCRFNPEHFPC